MEKHPPTYAVLTGDIVKSTAIHHESLRLLFKDMKQAALRFAGLYPNSVVGGLAVTQGDRWQITLRRHDLAERLTVLMTATARKHGQITRIAIGLGAVDRLVSKHISESTGEAFTLSGHALGELEKSIYKKQYWRVEGKNAHPCRRILIALLGDIASMWTRQQAEAVSLLVLREMPEQIAQSLGIQRSALAKRLASARWRFFEMALNEEDVL
jgi:hypothetical protein